MLRMLARLMRLMRRLRLEEGGSTMKKWLCVPLSLAVVLAVTGNAHAVTAVPEMDASGAVTALSLLAGVVALAADRLRRRK